MTYEHELNELTITNKLNFTILDNTQGLLFVYLKLKWGHQLANIFV